MTLIKSISGIRGTIGGHVSDGLNPVSTAQFTAAYAAFIRKHSGKARPLIIVGRDARISGIMVNRIVTGTLLGMGCDVIDIGLATTPTTEMAVTGKEADGGIILTASHNPKQWNALKLLNGRGEFLSDADGKEILRLAEHEDFDFAEVDEMGTLLSEESYLDDHIQAVLALPAVDVEAIRRANFRVAFDSVNSVGGIALPALFKALGVDHVTALNAEPTGHFAHNPEPLPEHLVDICSAIGTSQVDVGFVVDPDVDRLAIIDERGTFFGEEYTLVAVADYLLSLNGGGNTVSNLSSTRALRDVTERHGGTYTAAAVGEVNVVTKMKETGALIGGEGNGGVIYPELHYGRDALVGIALFLSLLAKSGKKVSELRATYPDYYMSKQRVDLPQGVDTEALLSRLAREYQDKGTINLIDGVKIDLPTQWVHVRRSNTEPIIRIYTEAPSSEEAQALADEFKATLLSYLD
ncbi:phosphoglucosamine mutase [Porphyromonas sp. oral taxon 278 str. W7784]|uniref:phosphoglucosamine mutase n=1 Tax=Porphyromonas sp. oral taxon 278 TaxID=712437 RepID=UPI0003AD66CB|nr:phosphoglucosamine mutase [Porphyromonas sp. oral taxon 278]ERJ69270.1 phosphoglucosamine mutase [Porphyromonas sp. oral taxon 278 str. W7784]